MADLKTTQTRIEVLRRILSRESFKLQLYTTSGYCQSNKLNPIRRLVVHDAPLGLEEAHRALFTPEALKFLAELLITFEPEVKQLHARRAERRCQLKCGQYLPRFSSPVPSRPKDWTIAPLPKRLRNRHLDLGDVSPANLTHFISALNCDVQGIQVDFDDGHCPSWSNQLLGLHNVLRAVRGQLPISRSLQVAPVLMLRPRAWNMTEHHALLEDQAVPGALFDFGLLMFHASRRLLLAESGPYFYLSKLESASEARLWNKIFVWTQDRLDLPQGTIKACVLIENILSAFEMEDILYELRDHSLGLNCGIWDYAASIINKLGHRPQFVLPDRSRYVDVRQVFMQAYIAQVVSTCHRRAAPATGGMSALVVPRDDEERANVVIDKVYKDKQFEIYMGLDGFMVYDTKLVPSMIQLWQSNPRRGPQQSVNTDDLLTMPPGGVTLSGLKHNIAVTIQFISHWMLGQGHFQYCGVVEDSATAEISRSQVWQWIQHNAAIEESKVRVTLNLVRRLARDFVLDQQRNGLCDIMHSQHLLECAQHLFLDLVAAREPPEFITSFLADSHVFQSLTMQ